MRGYADRSHPRRERRDSTVLHHGKKVLRIASGAVLILVGLALSLPGIPGPGIAVVILGLSVLSTDFEFARRWMDKLKTTARRWAGHAQDRDGRSDSAR